LFKRDLRAMPWKEKMLFEFFRRALDFRLLLLLLLPLTTKYLSYHLGRGGSRSCRWMK